MTAGGSAGQCQKISVAAILGNMLANPVNGFFNIDDMRREAVVGAQPVIDRHTKPAALRQVIEQRLRLLLLVFVELSLFSACSQDQAPPSPDPLSTRQVKAGTVVGFANRYNTGSWLGIPFASAPTGELRWRAPQLPQHWTGTRESSEFGLYPIPNLLRDGVVLPKGDPLAQLARGNFNRVPVILGTNRDEMKTMMIRDPHYTKLRFGLLPHLEDQPLYDRVTTYGSQMWKAIGADETARAMAAAGHQDVFVYRFDWDGVPSNWLLDFKALPGAGHSFEIPFVFYDVDNEMTYMPFDLIDEDNMAGAKPIARAMSAYWGHFTHEGVPGTGLNGGQTVWRHWREGGKYLVFDTRADVGIRMQESALDRTGIFRQLAADGAKLGGQAGVCLAYTTLFGEDAIFSFVAQCPAGTDCAGAPSNFCLEQD